MTWEDLDIDVKGRRKGHIKTNCPKCSPNKKRQDLSVDLDNGLYKCHRSSCDFHGTIVEKKEYKPVIYTRPQFSSLPLNEKTLAWFQEKRKISQSTLLRMQVTEEKIFMPQVNEERNCIAFNYYRDGELINIKYRDGAKNFRMVKEAELIFYGLDLIEGKDYCIITEGEIDQLSFYEAGNYPVVSVPNGANKGQAKLEYLDNCHTHFDDKKKIYLATDNDEAGIALRHELARRLGKERCWIISYPEGCKDANDVLVIFGAEELRKCYELATQMPIEGIFEVKDLDGEIDNLYLNGFPEGCKIGYPRFDELISFRTGELTTITGIPNSGKSEFMDQVYVRLASRFGWRFGIFSAENQPSALHFSKLAEKYIGKPFWSQNDKMDKWALEAAKEFIGEHFYFVRTDAIDLSVDALLEKARELVVRKGINAFVIDPWNRVEHCMPKGLSETQYVNEALTKIYRFKEVNDVHFFIVAHPQKPRKDKDGKYPVPTLYDISGSAHFFNKTDNGITVYREINPEKNNGESDTVFAYIQKIRFKFVGRIGYSEFDYELTTGRYKEKNQFVFDREQVKPINEPPF